MTGINLIYRNLRKFTIIQKKKTHMIRKRVGEYNKKHKKKLKEITKKINYEQSLVDQYEYQIRQNNEEIDFYINPIKDHILLEKWKTELKMFYGLD